MADRNCIGVRHCMSGKPIINVLTDMNGKPDLGVRIRDNSNSLVTLMRCMVDKCSSVHNSVTSCISFGASIEVTGRPAGKEGARCNKYNVIKSEKIKVETWIISSVMSWRLLISSELK